MSHNRMSTKETQMKLTYFAISELKELSKIYERENGERRFSYIQHIEYFKREKGISWKKAKKKVEVKLIERKIKLWDRRIASIDKAIEILIDK